MRLALAFVPALFCVSAHAQTTPPPARLFQAWSSYVAASFNGVIDTEGSSVQHFWGLAAGSKALGVANTKAADLCSATGCAGANLCSGVAVLSTGLLDINTGLYCNSATQTVATWCAGLTSGCTHGGTGRLSALYDQKNPSTAADEFKAASYAVAPDFILLGFTGTLAGTQQPVWGCVSSRSTQLVTGTITAVNAPNSLGMTYERNANFTTQATAYSDGNGTPWFGGTTTTNTIFAVAQSTVTGTAADGSGTSDFSHPHAVLITQPPVSAGTFYLYIDGGIGGSTAVSYGDTTTTTLAVCSESNTGQAAVDAYMTRVWIDNTQVGTTTAEAVTNSATVPFP